MANPIDLATLFREQIGGRRNLIINGAMQVAQRGTSHTSPGYTLDRIYSDIVNGTVTQDTADVPDQFTSALKFTASSSSAYTLLYQPFEASDFAVFKNKTVTVSGFVKASSDFSGQMYFHLQGGTIADTMTGGTWTTADIEYFTPTTTWQRFEATLSAPNSNGCRLVFGPALAQNSGVSWSITGLQLEVGDTATPFEHRSYGEELALCQRYYWKPIGSINTDGSTGYKYGTAGSTLMFNSTYAFPVTMRASPTATIISTGTLNNCSNMSISVTIDAYTSRVTKDGSTGTYRAFSWVADFNAEL
jgi:hypothetical protein